MFTTSTTRTNTTSRDALGEKANPRFGGMPLGFEAGDANLYRYVNNRPTSETDPSGLYNRDIHFYMTYYLACAAGLIGPDHNSYLLRNNTVYSEAYVIAWADEFTDFHPNTEPIQFALPAPTQRFVVPSPANQIRLKFHFRHTPGGTTRPGSLIAGQIADQAIRGVTGGVQFGCVLGNMITDGDYAQNLMLLGIGLHAYQDSFSHAGLDASHPPGLGIVNPDNQWLNQDRQDAAMRMAEGTYDILVRWRNAAYPGSSSLRSFAEIAPTLRRIFALEGPGGSDPARPNPAIPAWIQAIRTFEGADQDLSPPVDNVPAARRDPWATIFAAAAGRVENVPLTEPGELDLPRHPGLV